MHAKNKNETEEDCTIYTESDKRVGGSRCNLNSRMSTTSSREKISIAATAFTINIQMTMDFRSLHSNPNPICQTKFQIKQYAVIAPLDNPPHPMSLRTFAAGLGAWALLNAVVLAVTLAVSMATKWKAVHVHPEPIIKQVTVVVPGQVVEQIVFEEPPPDARLEVMRQRARGLKGRSSELSEALSASEQQQASVAAELQQQVDSLERNVNMLGHIRPEKQQLQYQYDKVDLQYLEEILHQPYLHGIQPQAQLQLMLDHAVLALETLKSSNVDWTNAEFDAVLNSPFVRNPSVNRDAQSCPPPADGMELNPNVARQHHLNTKIATVAALLKTRNDPTEWIGILTNSPTIRRTLDDETFEAIENLPVPQATEELEVEILEVDEAANTCIDKAKVDAMVQSALKDPTHMNDILTRMVRELDPTEANLIFDARLGMPGTTVVPSPQKVNLRQILDSGLTKWTAQQLDGVWDLLSGHNDFLDGMIDQWLESHPDSTVGQFVVGQMLWVAGAVSVPKLFQTKAGMLTN
jgi:TolA-binding protein